jgi:hypothetical protein
MKSASGHSPEQLIDPGTQRSMIPPARQIRTPVRREGASRYLLILLISFAASVTLTRLFLQLTGYPRIGVGSLHIAHLLWGGLLLFLASLLPLFLANRWVYPLSAALAGAGTGLFIDEVGKYITSANDYFYPPAAPIIYVFFLLTVWIYVQIRKPASEDPRAAFYQVLEGLEEVLDRDLEPSEQTELVRRLRAILRGTEDPDLVRLGTGLLQYLESGGASLAPSRPAPLARARAALAHWESRALSRARLRMIVAGGLATLGAVQVAGLLQLVLALNVRSKLESILAEWVLESHVSSVAALDWFFARLALEASVGVLLLLAAGLLIARRERPAVSLGTIGLMLSLAGTNLLAFYFDQFSTILPAAVEFLWLLLLLRYRAKYLLGSGN